LAGCMTVPNPKPAVNSPPPPPAAPVAPAAMEAPAVTPEPVPPEQMIQAPAMPPPEAAVVNAPEPVRMMPAPIPSEGAALRARFGNPDFVRREMDAELWRYDRERCAVFFFMQREGAMLRLRYTETLPRGMSMAADPACLETLEQRVDSAPPDIMNPAGPPP
jgi:hypothetical protein